MTIFDLQQAVVCEHFCSMDIFWDNVGSDRKKVIEEVHKATKSEQLHPIIQRYI